MSQLEHSKVQALLSSKRFGRSLHILEETESTMDDARAAHTEGAEDGHTIVADTQSKGRGAHGRIWESPPASDLYLSLVCRHQIPIADLAPLTLAIGLGVRETICKYVEPKRIAVKWPNDIWIDAKKCAGVLIESGPREAAIIGVGLNVNRTHWSEELNDQATSLRVATENRNPLDRNQVLAELLDQLERWADTFFEQGISPIAEALDSCLALRGEAVRCGELQGTLSGVDESGAALIENNGTQERIVAGRLEPLQSRQ